MPRPLPVPRRFAAPMLLLAAGLSLATTALAGAADPAVITSPGPEYADAARMFQGIPALERSPRGRLWAAWYGGGVTEDRHNYIILSTSGDDGRTWQRALVIDPDRDGPVRAFDPCLWHDPTGRLWLFWAQRRDGAVPETSAITTADSANAAAAWSQPRRLFEGILMNKPIVARDGRWLFPTAVWHTDGSNRVIASSDRGATFARAGAANVPAKADRNCDEPMLVQRKDDSLWLLVRTRYGIGQSVSTDGGKTWPDVEPTGIPHPASRFFVRRLASGRLLLVRHNPPAAANVRSHLAAFLSDDDGRTWKGGLLLDDRRGVSYPDGAQAEDGMVYLIYDYERQRDKEILMAVVSEDDILQGKVASPNGRLRARVNQASGVNPTVKERSGTGTGGGAPPAKASAAKAPAALSDNADGAALLDGPAPEIEVGEGEADVLAPGARLFLDRRYDAKAVPDALRGRTFVRLNITGGRAVCRKPGAVYVITPSAGRQRDSLAEALAKKGFAKVRLPEFMLFEGEQNISSVFQKTLAEGETLVIDKWGVLVLAGEAAKVARRSSVELAAESAAVQVWDPNRPFPMYDQMPFLDAVTHVQLERAEPKGYHYLHESAIAWHKGVLHAGWANHRQLEVNVKDELLRGRRSTDGGLTWSAATTWAEAPLGGSESYNHPVLFSHGDTLWGFFTAWGKELPRTEIFNLDEKTGAWRQINARIPGFVPFNPPRKMRDGNWIIGGELHWYEAAVAISKGDDFTRWEVVQIPRPEAIRLQFPETTLLDLGDTLVAICRPKDARTAPAAVSKDCARTWTPLAPSNFPLAASKPLCGQLTTGQHYLITNNLEQGRTLLSIAVTEPGGKAFCRAWKIRHQQFPRRRLLGSLTAHSSVGGNTEWSYPAAVEHDGKLYITYTQGKEDCALSIIPLSALAVK